MKFIIFLFAFSLYSIPHSDEDKIKDNLKRYNEALKSMDVDGILSLFAEDAIYGKIKGKSEIRKSLSNNKSVKIININSSTLSLSISGTIATHLVYFRHEAIVKEKTKNSKGIMRIIWKKNGSDWKIKYITTELDDSK
ncbi:MAG: hypothetical protein RLZZ546_2135 [Bacteroidota bacterium]|jgi:ketosteroid isomerase-like protein